MIFKFLINAFNTLQYHYMHTIRSNLTIDKLVFSVLLTMEENGVKAQLKTMLFLLLLSLQSIDCQSVTQLNFVIGPLSCLDRKVKCISKGAVMYRYFPGLVLFRL